MNPTQKFSIADKPTIGQLEFFNEYGFIHYKHVFTRGQINTALEELKRIERYWVNSKLEKVNGTPVKYGKDENGNRIVQRFAFTSQFSKFLHGLLQDERLQNLKYFIGHEARLTENERDGMVVNHYVNTDESAYTKLGWHTDGARDLFTHFRLDPMLNIGIYFTDSNQVNGDLRLIPGSHKQGIFKMLFYKKYFLDNETDKDEFEVEAEAGDVTVHSGRLWHRVAKGAFKGEASKRIVSYVPIIAGKYMPKHDDSPTPVYHRFLHKIR